MKISKIKLLWAKLILGIISTLILWSYSAWHIIYSWNNPELTSMQVFQHILKTLSL